MKDKKLKKFENGIYIAYDDNIDFNNIDDDFIDSIYEVNISMLNMLNTHTDSEFRKKISSYTDLIKDMIRKTPKEKRIDFLNGIDTVELIDNIRQLFRENEQNISKEEIITFFEKNPELYGNNISNIKSNYRYLREQNYILNDELDKIYLDSSIINIDTKIKEILKNKEQVPKQLAKLLIPSTDKNKESLKNNLKYIVKTQGVITKDDVDEHVKSYFNRTLLENITAYDNELLEEKSQFLENSVYSSYFNGIKSEIELYLNHINKNFLKDFDDLYKTSEFADFFNSLHAIKNWDKYEDYITRAEDLRDEFITRIMFASIWDNACQYRSTNLKNRPKDEKAIVNEVKNSFVNNPNEQKCYLKDDLIKYSDFHLSKTTLMLSTCESIDPFFTVKNDKSAGDKASLKSAIKPNLQNLILFNYPRAKKYISEPPARNKKKPLNQLVAEDNERLINDLQFSILNPKIADKKKENILNKTAKLMKTYTQSRGHEKNRILTQIFKNLNYYMIANNEYEILNFRQQNSHDEKYKPEDTTSLPKKMLNTKDGKFNNQYNTIDRIMYFLYNSNRLAHSIDETIVYTLKDEDLVVNENKGINKDKKNIYMTKYSTLGRFGLTIDWVNQSIENYLNNSNITIYNLIDKYKNSSPFLMNYLYAQSLTDKNTIKKEPITQNNINDILKELVDLKDNKTNSLEVEKNNKKVRDSIKLISEERNFFFNLKKFFMEELMNKTQKTVGKKIEDMTPEDKNNLFINKDYIVELQNDRKSKDVVLLCMNKKFNLPFSLHYINRSKIFQKQKLDKNQKASHYINQRGITEKKEEIIKDTQRNEVSIKAGFFENPEKIPERNANYEVELANFVNIYTNYPEHLNTTDNKKMDGLKFLTDIVINPEGNIPFENIDKKVIKKTHEKASDIIAEGSYESIQNIISSLDSKSKIKIYEDNQMRFDKPYYIITYNNEKIYVPQDCIDKDILERKHLLQNDDGSIKSFTSNNSNNYSKNNSNIYKENKINNDLKQQKKIELDNMFYKQIHIDDLDINKKDSQF